MLILRSRYFCMFIVLTVLLGFSGIAQTSTLRATDNLTALDEYVAAPDSSYTWELRETQNGKGWTGYVLYMASQTWLTADEVDRPLWEHWLVIVAPDEVVSTTGFMMIGGGSNKEGNMPKGGDANLRRCAKATKTIAPRYTRYPMNRYTSKMKTTNAAARIPLSPIPGTNTCAQAIRNGRCGCL